MDYAVEYFKDFKRQREEDTILPSIAQLLQGSAEQVADAQSAVLTLKKNSTLGTVLAGILSLVVALGKFLINGALILGRMLLRNPYVLSALGITAAGVGVYKLLTGGKDDGVQMGHGVGDVFDNPFTLSVPTPAPKDMTRVIRKKASIIRSVTEGAKVVGVDPNLMLGIVKAESSFGQNTYNTASSAQGIFQILPSTWKEYYPRFAKKYGIPKNDPNDPESAAIFSAAYVKEVLNPIVRSVKGEDATAADLYMLYVFGPAGGKALIQEYTKNPNAYSAEVHRKRSYGQKQINANPSFFYFKNGAPKTLAQTFNLARSKVALTEGEKIELKSVSVPKPPTQVTQGTASQNPNAIMGTEGNPKDYDIVHNKDGRLVKVER